MKWWARVLAGLAVAASAVLFFHPLCNAMFRCGCAPAWSGAAEHCNVRAPAGAHCPWCEHRGLGTLGFALTLAGQGLVLRLARRRVSVAAATLLAVLALPLAAVLSGSLAWLATDYPHFLLKDARARLGVPAGPLATVR